MKRSQCPPDCSRPRFVFLVLEMFAELTSRQPHGDVEKAYGADAVCTGTIKQKQSSQSTIYNVELSCALGVGSELRVKACWEAMNACTPQRLVQRLQSRKKAMNPEPQAEQERQVSQCKKCLYEVCRSYGALCKRESRDLQGVAGERSRKQQAGRGLSGRKQELPTAGVAHVLSSRGGLGNKAATPEILE